MGKWTSRSLFGGQLRYRSFLPFLRPSPLFGLFPRTFLSFAWLLASVLAYHNSAHAQQSPPVAEDLGYWGSTVQKTRLRTWGSW